MQRYVFPTKIEKVESRQRALRAYKVGPDNVKVEYEQLGYFIVLDGTGMAFRVAADDPGIPAGAPARVIIEIDDKPD